MLSKISLWTGLIGVGATIALIQPIATAKTSVEVGEIARTISVLITAPNNVGSGVILQQEGDLYTVLTAAHVVKNKVSYKITTPDGQAYQIISGSIRFAPGNIDLAVFKFKSTTKYATARLGNCNILKSGMDVYVAGFPGASGGITEQVFVFREGKVSANSTKTFDRGFSLVYSNNTLPGMSGGAVLNSEGELVAIHGRGDRELQKDGTFGAKTGFNLGIPVNRFATMASNMGVKLDKQIAPIPQSAALNADDYFVSAVQKSDKGDDRGALADYNQLLALDPKNALAYYNRGILKVVKLNDTQGALADYNRAIALDPKYAYGYYNRGVLKKERLNDTQGALTDFDRAIALDPKYASAYIGRGRLKVDKFDDTQGALVDYDRAIALDSKFAHGYYNRGLLKVSKLNDVRGALVDYDRAIALDPKYAYGYYSRGFLKAEKLNDFRGALLDYDRAIALNPKYATGYNYRGLLKAEKLDDFRGALADFNQALLLDPKSTLVYIRRGRLKVEQLNDPQGALADFNRAISLQESSSNALDPTLAYGYNSRGLLKYQKLNDVPGAFADVTKAIAFNPKYIDAYYNRGDFFYSMGNKVAAIADFRKVAEIDRSDYMSLIAQGVIQTQQGAYPQAIALFNETAKISPTSGDTYKYRGEAFKQQGDRAAAIRDWQKAAQTYKNNGQLNDHQVILGWLRSLGAGE